RPAGNSLGGERNIAWLLTDEGGLTEAGEPSSGVPFNGQPVTAGAARDGRVALIINEHEVWTRTRGRWRKDVSTDLDLFSLAWTDDGHVLVGTEQARLAAVDDGTLRFLSSFDDVAERPLWDTPYDAPPELRSLAAGVDGTLYANVHVGWIVRSRDRGKTWTSIRNGLDRDVHMVAAHPSRPATVFAATAVGFHISHDYGDRFVRRREGMPYHYQRAVACFPERDVYLASTAMHDGGEGAQLYRSEDEGRHWTRVSGLPDVVNRNLNTHQVAALVGGRALAVIRDTSLYVSEDWGVTWREVASQLPMVNAILVV
ncbi:MAG: hypothetical protein AABX36_02655, partial [Candidatus Thermoplasmatota archaeon]